MANSPLSCVASGTVTQYTFQKVAGIVRGQIQCAVAAAAGTVANAEPLFGIALETVATTKTVRVAPLDGSIQKVIAGGALTPGTNLLVTCNNEGKAVAAGAGDKILGQFLYSADSNSTDGTAAAGDIVYIITGHASY